MYHQIFNVSIDVDVLLYGLLETPRKYSWYDTDTSLKTLNL